MGIPIVDATNNYDANEQQQRMSNVTNTCKQFLLMKREKVTIEKRALSIFSWITTEKNPHIDRYRHLKIAINLLTVFFFLTSFRHFRLYIVASHLLMTMSQKNIHKKRQFWMPRSPCWFLFVIVTTTTKNPKFFSVNRSIRKETRGQIKNNPLTQSV